jgi:hypothetical protein
MSLPPLNNNSNNDINWSYWDGSPFPGNSSSQSSNSHDSSLNSNSQGSDPESSMSISFSPPRNNLYTQPVRLNAQSARQRSLSGNDARESSEGDYPLSYSPNSYSPMDMSPIKSVSTLQGYRGPHRKFVEDRMDSIHRQLNNVISLANQEGIDKLNPELIANFNKIDKTFCRAKAYLQPSEKQDLQTILQTVKENSKTKLQQCSVSFSNEILREFNKGSKAHIALFNAAVDKIASLNEKIQRDEPVVAILLDDNPQTEIIAKAVLKALNSIADENDLTNVLNNFRKRYPYRKEKYIQLKEIFLDSLIQYKTLEDEVKKSVFISETLGAVKELSKVKTMCQETVREFQTNLKKFSIETLCPNKISEKMHEYKLDETDMHSCLEQMHTYKFAGFAHLTTLFQTLNEDHQNVLSKINKELKNISTTMENKIKGRYDKIASLYENDKEKIKQLDLQIQNSLSSYTVLQQEIPIQWNEFCMNLYELNHQKVLFDIFESVEKKMSWAFLMAECIKRALQPVDSRKDVEKNLQIQKEHYNELCRLIRHSEIENHNEGLKFLDVDSLRSKFNFFNPYVFYKTCTPTPTPDYEPDALVLMHQSLLESIEYAQNSTETFVSIYALKKNAKTEEIFDAMGLLSIDKKTDDDTNTRIEKKREQFRQEMSNAIVQMKFNEVKLKELCLLVAQEINKTEKYLNATKHTNKYDNQFTKVYNTDIELIEGVQKQVQDKVISNASKLDIGEWFVKDLILNDKTQSEEIKSPFEQDTKKLQ